MEIKREKLNREIQRENKKSSQPLTTLNSTLLCMCVFDHLIFWWPPPIAKSSSKIGQRKKKDNKKLVSEEQKKKWRRHKHSDQKKKKPEKNLSWKASINWQWLKWIVNLDRLTCMRLLYALKLQIKVCCVSLQYFVCVCFFYVCNKAIKRANWCHIHNESTRLSIKTPRQTELNKYEPIAFVSNSKNKKK